MFILSPSGSDAVPVCPWPGENLPPKTGRASGYPLFGSERSPGLGGPFWIGRTPRVPEFPGPGMGLPRTFRGGQDFAIVVAIRNPGPNPGPGPGSRGVTFRGRFRNGVEVPIPETGPKMGPKIGVFGVQNGAPRGGVRDRGGPQIRGQLAKSCAIARYPS